MKYLSIIIVIAILAGCATGPSVCDTTQNSVLCDLSQERGVRLEDVGLGLIVANSIAIGEGRYTREEARAVLIELRAVLDNPVSYAFFRAQVFDKMKKYPELIMISQVYFDEMTSGQIMYQEDRSILSSWLDDRIEALK